MVDETLNICLTEIGRVHLNYVDRDHKDCVPGGRVTDWEKMFGSFTIETLRDAKYLVTVTQDGLAMRFPTDVLIEKIQEGNCFQLVPLGFNSFNMVGGAVFTNGNEFITLVTQDGGVLIVDEETILPQMNLANIPCDAGQQAIRLDAIPGQCASVVAVDAITGGEEYLLLLSSDGYCKKIRVDELLEKDESGKIRAMPFGGIPQDWSFTDGAIDSLDRKAIVNGRTVSDEDVLQILTYTNNSYWVNVRDIPVCKLYDNPIRMFELADSEYIFESFVAEEPTSVELSQYYL